MAPNKFEEHIKNQLEDREISPSADAWDKLSEQLNATGQKERKSYPWFGIAASLIGILMISVFYFNSRSNSLGATHQVVEIPAKKSENIEFKEKPEERVVAVGIIDNDNKLEQKSEKESNSLNTIPDSNSVVASVDDTNGRFDKGLENIQPEEIINNKVLELLAQVEVLEKENETLTDTEVDSLLRKAQEEIITERLFRNNRSVDAMALLSEVEEDLDKSLRDQLFESLKTGFLKVRTAVADRNN